MKTTENLKQAVIAYQSGDAAAFETIYKESSGYLYVCIRNIMQGNDDLEHLCEDILQDTYMQIVKSIGQLKKPETFLSWAGAVANSRCYKYLEKNKRYRLLSEDDQLFEDIEDDELLIPESVMQDKEQQRILRDMIQNELTEMQRICVIGYYFNEQKQSEIAEELGIPENTVKTNLARAKKKLKLAVECFEKKENTKLYTLAPVLLLMLETEITECAVPMEVTAAVFAQDVAFHGAGSAKAVGGIGKKMAELTIKQKLAAAVVTAAVAGGAVGAGVMLRSEPVEVSETLADYEHDTFYILADKSNADTSSRREMPEDTNAYAQEINMEMTPEIYLLKEQIPIYTEEWVENGYTKENIYIRLHTCAETEFVYLLLCREQDSGTGEALFWVRTEDWMSADKEIVGIEEHEVYGGEIVPATDLPDEPFETEDGARVWEITTLIEGETPDHVDME